MEENCMNKLEKDILESEMGLYSRAPSNASGKSKPAEDDMPKGDEKIDTAATDEALPLSETDEIQLKIDDWLLGPIDSGEEGELDLSSLEDNNEAALTDDEELEYDGTVLYQKTLLLIESGEVDLLDGIALLKKNAADGHALSWLYVGQLYSNKDGEIYNPALAFESFKNAADMGADKGYYNLGICYSSGFGCERDEVSAFDCFSLGAKKFDPDCVYALGVCYEFGIGCDVNYEYAVKLYEKGLELGHADAANNLGGCLFYGHGTEQDTDRAVEVYREAARLGSSNALCRLGIIYEEGKAAVKDTASAFEYYKEAAAKNNPIGLYRLAGCHERGNGTEQDFNEAFKYYALSASHGYAPASYEAGLMCSEGRGTKKNYDRAYKYFVSAAENGYPPAEYEVAGCYFDGRGIMKDRESAYIYYKRVYDTDDANRADAAYKIGLCRLHGLAVKKDESLAFDWFTRAANGGSADALYMLGECYFFGVGVAPNERSAAECFIKAESKLSAVGEYSDKHVSLLLSLSRCFELGIGTEKDHKRARQLYKSASESGRADALYEMGRAAMHGIGMKAEYPAARQYFLRAARKGYVPAMFMMGSFADEGRGVVKNKKDARSWYLKAVNAEHGVSSSPYDFPERVSEALKLYTESKIKAQYKLGMIVAETDKSLKGYTEAFEYISLSASMGYTDALTEITKIYNSGGDLVKYFEAKHPHREFSVFADDGSVNKDLLSEAMNKLGDTFFDGKHTLKKNETAAARCYRLSAELGNIDACYSYGWCLRHGVGVRENDSESVKWLKLAADKGNASAAYSYGLCCEEGLSSGVKNKREALYYYRLAAAAGHNEAAKRFLQISERE